MGKEKPELEPEQAAIIKDLFTEMEREGGDREATREDFLVALDLTERYMRPLGREEFWERVDKGEFSIKNKWEKDAHGDNVLTYLEIRDKNGEILFMENFGALSKIEEQNRTLAQPLSED